MLIFHHLSFQPDFSQTSATSGHFPAKSQNRQKCPKFCVSNPRMNNYTSSHHNSIVVHPTPQIWAYFIKFSKQTFWQPQIFFFWHTKNPSKHLPQIFRGQFSNRFFGGRGRAAAIGGGARSYLWEGFEKLKNIPLKNSSTPKTFKTPFPKNHKTVFV